MIVIGSGLVYKHFSNIAHQRNNAAISTEEFIQQNYMSPSEFEEKMLQREIAI
ncbi:hypothetical protein [Aliarcobacter butzleri]|uniref:hypothetical protein n=1 Tax=Aliarcobacter butzleri TaxID=28197 RepID=UPI0018686A50|nr:hypothetical protein [Aliarcobacter butzleri]